MIFNKLIKQEADVIKLITENSKVHGSILITYLNQHCFNIYNSNKEYRNLLNNDFLVFLDGFGVYAALKFLGYKEVQKFNATDLYSKIFQSYLINKTKIFLIGGNFSNQFISQKSVEKNLNFCGYQNGYFNDKDSDKMIESIKIASPEVIIIGMGVPGQEILAAKISKIIINIRVLCVGGFLEFYFGTKTRAPKILRISGMEWLHRLLSEPGRLGKRYLIGIPRFLFQIIKMKFSN